MPRCDTLIRNVRVLDGSGAESQTADVAVDAGRVCAIGQLSDYLAGQVTEGNGRVLSPASSMSIPTTIPASYVILRCRRSCRRALPR